VHLRSESRETSFELNACGTQHAQTVGRLSKRHVAFLIYLLGDERIRLIEIPTLYDLHQLDSLLLQQREAILRCKIPMLFFAIHSTAS